MSLIVRAGTPWPNEYEGTVKWSEKTRQAQFGEHGPLFDRFFSFEEIPNLMISVMLGIPKVYDIARKGPTVEIKVVKGGEILDDLNSGFSIKISFSSILDSGAVEYSGPIGNLIKGHSQEGYDDRSKRSNIEYKSIINGFSYVFGHNKSLEIKVMTINYMIKFNLDLNKQAFQRSPLTLGKRLSEKLFLKDEFSDVKILCEDKIFPCHKNILGSQSEVFKSMLSNTDMVEASSREIKIADISAKVMETLLHYLYFDQEDLMANKNKITIGLLLAADKYNIPDLTAICVNYLKENLSKDNVVDIMKKSYMINQHDLFDVARKFVQNCKNNGEVVEMGAFDEMKKIHPNLALEMLTEALFQTHEMEGGESDMEQFQCVVCKEEFESRTKLFRHLEENVHATQMKIMKHLKK